MNEPKKSEIEAAAKKKWPAMIGSKINHRKHTMDIVFTNGKALRRLKFWAASHRDLLKGIEGSQLKSPFSPAA